MFSAKHISVLFLAGIISLPAFAFQGGNPTPQGQGRPSLGPDAGRGQGRRPGPHFGDFFRKNLTPQQREKALESDPNFQKLPAERKQRLMDRLQKFNALPPAQQQRILNRMEIWEHMTPDQHKQARALFDRMQALPDERRSAVRDQVRSLATMTPDQRQKTMNSEQFKRNFNDDERNLMQNWLELRDTNTKTATPSLNDPPQQ
jgi:hypothetical protein